MTQKADNSLTTLRLLYYPPLPANGADKPGQLRCGEHVDYGSITLLFQDPSGGLQVYACTCSWRKISSVVRYNANDPQVKCTSGGYIDVPYQPDAVLVNLGALMQNWTSDIYKATVRLFVLALTCSLL